MELAQCIVIQRPRRTAGKGAGNIFVQIRKNIAADIIAYIAFVLIDLHFFQLVKSDKLSADVAVVFRKSVRFLIEKQIDHRDSDQALGIFGVWYEERYHSCIILSGPQQISAGITVT